MHICQIFQMFLDNQLIFWTTSDLTYSRVEASTAYCDDRVIIIDCARTVLGMAEEVSGEKRLAWIFVLGGSKDDCQAEKQRIKIRFCA